MPVSFENGACASESETEYISACASIRFLGLAWQSPGVLIVPHVLFVEGLLSAKLPIVCLCGVVFEIIGCLQPRNNFADCLIFAFCFQYGYLIALLESVPDSVM